MRSLFPTLPSPVSSQSQELRPASAASVLAATSDNGRFSKDALGVITDNLTGLEWYLSPDGYFTWDRAKEWVDSLSVAGGGWRMPGRDELAGIRTKKRGDCFFDPIFPKSSGWWCGWVWSGETSDASTAWIFDFDFDGKEDECPTDESYDCLRAFAVRSRS